MEKYDKLFSEKLAKFNNRLTNYRPTEEDKYKRHLLMEQYNLTKQTASLALQICAWDLYETFKLLNGFIEQVEKKKSKSKSKRKNKNKIKKEVLIEETDLIEQPTPKEIKTLKQLNELGFVQENLLDYLRMCNGNLQATIDLLFSLEEQSTTGLEIINKFDTLLEDFTLKEAKIIRNLLTGNKQEHSTALTHLLVNSTGTKDYVKYRNFYIDQILKNFTVEEAGIVKDLLSCEGLKFAEAKIQLISKPNGTEGYVRFRNHFLNSK